MGWGGGRLFTFRLSPSTCLTPTDSPWPPLYAKGSALATSLSCSKACWGSHRLGTEVPTSGSGTQGPPDPRSGSPSRLMMAIITITAFTEALGRQDTRCPRTAVRTQRCGDMQPLVQGHSPRWNPHLLDSGPSSSPGLLSCPKGSWAGWGGGETIPPRSLRKSYVCNFRKCEKNMKSAQ